MVAKTEIRCAGCPAWIGDAPTRLIAGKRYCMTCVAKAENARRVEFTGRGIRRRPGPNHPRF